AGFAAAAMHVRGRPYLDRVELTALPESALGTELQAGRLDMTLGGGGGPLGAGLVLSIDPTRAPSDRPPVRAAVAAAVDPPHLVRHLLPGAAAECTLLTPSLLPSLGAEPATAPGSAPRTAATLAVSREVPSLVSQRVLAHLTELGLQVSADPRPPSRVLEGPPAALRLWLWTPEVPEAGLALEGLRTPGPPPPP